MRIVLLTICLALALAGCNVFFDVDSVVLDSDDPVSNTTTTGEPVSNTTTTGEPCPLGSGTCDCISETNCTCLSSCSLSCRECALTCGESQTCGFMLDEGSVVCARGSDCTVVCDDTCIVRCEDRASCNVGCAEGSCQLECRGDRSPDLPPGQRKPCRFIDCPSAQTCAGGITVCNRPCP